MQLEPMTIAEKYAAIVAMLKNEQGEWREDVNGGDLVEQVSLIIDAPDAPAGSQALQNEHPWCQWTLAFSGESDWDTPYSFGVRPLKDLNLLLTTADGRSRSVRIREAQWIEPPYDDEHAATPSSERVAGILVTELETENYEPIDPDKLEFVRYEDIREICVY